TRWLYWEAEPGLLDRNRADYVEHVTTDNLWIEARQRQPMDDFDHGVVIRDLGDNLGNGLSSYIPMFLLAQESHQNSLFGDGERLHYNISPRAIAYLEGVGAV